MLIPEGGSSGFQVVLADLQQAAKTFGTESKVFAGIMPQGLTVPDGGSAAFDSICQAVVDAIGALHLQIAGDISAHATKLQQAHDNYQRTEESLTALLGQLTSTMTAG